MIIKNNDDKTNNDKKKKKKRRVKTIASTERVCQWDPKIRKLKITTFGGGRGGFRTVSVFPRLTGRLGSCWDLCSQIPWAFHKVCPVLWLLLFSARSHFCPPPNPTLPEMPCVGIPRKRRSGLFCKLSIFMLGRTGFESLTCGFLGTVRDGPGRGLHCGTGSGHPGSGAEGATPTPLPPQAHEAGTPSPLSTRWHS